MVGERYPTSSTHPGSRSSRACSKQEDTRNKTVAVRGRKMDGELESAEAEGQIKGKGRACGVAWRGREKEDGGRDGEQGAVWHIPALSQARGAAHVQAAKSSWSCAAQNFGDFGDSPYLGPGTRERRGKRGRGRGKRRPQRSPRQRDRARGSVLVRHRHNPPPERNPAIKLTAQTTDFCLYNYGRSLSAHSLRHRDTHISIL